jgi:hypothetical protein
MFFRLKYRQDWTEHKRDLNVMPWQNLESVTACDVCDSGQMGYTKAPTGYVLKVKYMAYVNSIGNGGKMTGKEFCLVEFLLLLF